MSLATRLFSALTQIGTDINQILSRFVSPTSVDILIGDITTGQNLFVDGGGSTGLIQWDSTTNNTSEITSFTDGDGVIQITNAGEILLAFAVVFTDTATNNRTVLMPIVNHLDSSDGVKRMYNLPSLYIRDDNNAYDAGSMGASGMVFFVEAGDKLSIENYVLDEGTTAGTMTPDSTLSQISIRKVVR